MKVNLKVRYDLLILHALTSLDVVEVLVGLHEELREVLHCEQLFLLNVRSICIFLFTTQLANLLQVGLAAEHFVDLVHAQVLHEQLVIFLHLQWVSQADFG